MKIYRVTDYWTYDTFFPTRASAMAELATRVERMVSDERNGFVEVIKDVLPKVTKEFMCRVLEHRGGSYADDQIVLRRVEVENGKVKTTFKRS